MTKSSASPKKPALPTEIPHFTPVPRQVRQENGWTPARQRKFIEALAETASVRQAALAVNMSKVSCYQLRNHPQGADFKRAWDAAVDAGVAFLKDIAFERAVEGELEPVWVRGEMKGYKRKFSNSLLMFLLRQYGQDNDGKRVTVNYVRTKAAVAEREVHSSQSVRIEPSRDADQSGAYLGVSTKLDTNEMVMAESETTTMTVRASKPGGDDTAKPERAAAMIEQFSGVDLDTEAEAEIAATLAACAARRREYGGGVHDLSESFIAQGKDDPTWRGNFEPHGGWRDDVEPFDPEESDWVWLGGDEAAKDECAASPHPPAHP